MHRYFGSDDDGALDVLGDGGSNLSAAAAAAISAYTNSSSGGGSSGSTGDEVDMDDEAMRLLVRMETRNAEEQECLVQVLKDLPRTGPDIPVLHHPRMQRLMLRVLFIWGMRHPGSGYVQVCLGALVYCACGTSNASRAGNLEWCSSTCFSQLLQRPICALLFVKLPQGINDLLIPFLVVFLRHEGGYSVAADVEKIPSETLSIVEADSFWCLSKLLDGLHDHYIASQPGLWFCTTSSVPLYACVQVASLLRAGPPLNS